MSSAVLDNAELWLSRHPMHSIEITGTADDFVKVTCKNAIGEVVSAHESYILEKALDYGVPYEQEED